MFQRFTLKNFTPSCDPLRILRNIQRAGFTSAIIGGGAIRDIYANKDIKDFDIFLYDPWVKTCPERIPLCKQTPTTEIDEDFIMQIMGISLEDALMSLFDDFDIVKVDHASADSSYFKLDHISQIWQVQYQTQTYQLVFLKKEPIKFIAQNFDMGICKAYCDGRKMHFMSDFLNDMRNKTITVCDAGYSRMHFEHVLRNHLQRVRLKYPGYTVEIDPKVAKFLNDKNKKYLTGHARLLINP